MKGELTKQYIKLLKELEAQYYEALSKIETKERAMGCDTDTFDREMQASLNRIRYEAASRGILLERK